jgi:transposase-like protein
MVKTYRRYSEEFRASAVALAEKESIAIASAKLGIADSLMRSWRERQRAEQTGDPLSPGSPAQTVTALKSATRKRRTIWSEADVTAMGAEWVSLRLADPLESATVLAERAQRKVFAGRGELQRDINSISNIQPLVRAIGKLWKELLERPAAPSVEPPPPAAPPVEPLPQIIEVEVVRKMTFAEMLAEVDEPALEALLSAKRLARENTFHQLLQSLASHNGNGTPKIAPFLARSDIYEPTSKRPRRIAIVGLPAAEQATLTAAVQAAQLTCSLQFPGGKDKDTVARCDYAIVCRPPGAINGDGDRAIGQLGRNKVALVDQVGAPAVLQRIRDFLSRA